MRPHNIRSKVELGIEFSRVLKEWLTADEMREVIRANNNSSDGPFSPWCASHDYCDANEAMLEAFENYFGREPELNGDDGYTIDEAWFIAKAADFFMWKGICND